MKRIRNPFLLGRIHRRVLYTAVIGLWLTGMAWWGLGLIADQTASWIQPLCLKIHGAAAMLFLTVFGMLFVQHIPFGWKQHRQRIGGVLLLTVCWVLTASGYGLYYFGNETLRQWTSWSHEWLGAFLPVIITAHVWYGRRTRG